MRHIPYLLTAMLSFILCSCTGEKSSPQGETTHNVDTTAKSMQQIVAKDPICGHVLNERTVVAKSVYRNVTYYFCSNGCKIRFDKHPESYASATALVH